MEHNIVLSLLNFLITKLSPWLTEFGASLLVVTVVGYSFAHAFGYIIRGLKDLAKLATLAIKKERLRFALLLLSALLLLAAVLFVPGLSEVLEELRAELQQRLRPSLPDPAELAQVMLGVRIVVGVLLTVGLAYLLECVSHKAMAKYQNLDAQQQSRLRHFAATLCAAAIGYLVFYLFLTTVFVRERAEYADTPEDTLFGFSVVAGFSAAAFVILVHSLIVVVWRKKPVPDFSAITGNSVDGGPKA